MNPDNLVPKGAAIGSLGLLLLAVFFGYQLFTTLRHGAIKPFLLILGAVYYGYLLGNYNGVGKDANFYERLFAVTLGAFIQLIIVVLNAFGAHISVS